MCLNIRYDRNFRRDGRNQTPPKNLQAHHNSEQLPTKSMNDATMKALPEYACVGCLRKYGLPIYP